MKLTVELLKRFIDIDAKAEVIAEQLTEIGYEAEVDGQTITADVLPNRPDCQSILGLARELSAFYGYKFNEHADDLELDYTLDLVKITPEAKPYVLWDTVVKIDNVDTSLTDNDPNIRQALDLLGLKSKNWIVDLTNAFTLIYGAPTHVFDAEAVSTGLTIDISKAGDTIKLLNGALVNLEAGCLVQKVAGQIIDLVGVMGGAESQYSGSKSFYLQAGGFESGIIRHNSKSTQIVTDSSYRYERGVPQPHSQLALKAMISHMKQVQPDIKITVAQNITTDSKPINITYDKSMLKQILGVEITDDLTAKISKVGLLVENGSVVPSSYRLDITNIYDVAEEIVRFVNLNKLPTTPLEPQAIKQPVGDFYKIRAIKNSLINLGLGEVITQAFSATEGKIGPINPLSAEQTFLRQSLEEGLAKTAIRNQYLPKLALFEVNNIFTPQEVTVLAIMVNGYKESARTEMMANISKALGIEVTPLPIEHGHYGLKSNSTFFVEIPIDKLEIEPLTTDVDYSLVTVKPISKYPPILRDISFLIDQADEAKLYSEIRQMPEAIVIEQIDRYQNDEKLGAGKIVVTYRIILQDENKTLTENEATQSVEKCLSLVKDKLQYEIR